MEIYSPEGLRLDGRRWNELRTFLCSMNTHPHSADGSLYVEQGNTKVMCTVSGPKEPLSRAHAGDEVRLTIALNIASFSTFERKKHTKTEKRLTEMRTILERTFAQSIVGHLHARTVIEVEVQVLAQDGGFLAAVTNAITLALVDAGIAMYEYVSAVSVGFHDQSPLLDLNAMEERELSAVTIGVIGKSEKLALLLLEDRLPLDKLEGVMGLAVAGSHRVRDLMDEEVRRHGRGRLARLTKL